MPNTSLTFGPFLIGAFLNTILYGVCLVQCFIYYQTYTRDAPWIRYFVLYLFLIETVNTGCDIGLVYEPLILHYGDPVSYINTPLMIIADPIITVLISTPVQFFIAWRIKIITGSMLLPAIIAFFGTCAFIGGIGTTVSVAILREYSQLRQFEGAVITWLTSSAAADILITASLSWSLMQRKSGIKATDDKVSRIIRLTVQTGLVTAIFALADVIIFVTVRNTTLNFIWDLALSKLYTNALLSTLNARAGWDNLTGQSGVQGSINVLFGSQELSRRRTNTGTTGQSQTVTGVIEMNTPSITGDHSSKSGRLEDGVAVHTVVECLNDSEIYGKAYKLNTNQV